MTELEYLRSERARLQDLIDRRPSINAGLIDEYVHWTYLCYQSDAVAGRWDGAAFRDVQSPAQGAH